MNGAAVRRFEQTALFGDNQAKPERRQLHRSGHRFELPLKIFIVEQRQLFEIRHLYRSRAARSCWLANTDVAGRSGPVAFCRTACSLASVR